MIDRAREIAATYTKDTHDRESLALAITFLVDDLRSELRRQSQELERAREALRQAAPVMKGEHNRFCWAGRHYICEDIDRTTCYMKWERLATLTQPAPEKP